MRPLAIVVVALGLAFAPRPALAQEHETGQRNAGVEKKEGFAEKHELALKWANFLLLAGLLGYFIGKNAGPFFAARSAGIRQDMDESLRQREQAEAKAADVDRRLADLGEDIAALRGHSEAEGKAETERMAQHTADEIAKIQTHAEREIASAGKAARMALKRYSAELAMGLAEQKVRARMTPDTEDALVQGFVRDLK
jgi:F0F1-type ATP synthase membrane subunit b/b'